MNVALTDNVPSGLPDVPFLGWGSHVGQLFQTPTDLEDALVPYFSAGLKNNERCLWVTGAPFRAEAARAALRKAVPDLDAREAAGQIEIQDIDAFYEKGQPLNPQILVDGLIEREASARAAGYKGLRTNGNCSWVEPGDWVTFQDYERRVQSAVQGRRMICMCSYCPEGFQAQEMHDLMAHHRLVLQPASGVVAKAATPVLVQEKAPHDFQDDIDAVAAISAVPSILDAVSEATGMRFAAIARVTPERWVCLASKDLIGFGLVAGGELKVETTICHEIRQSREAVIIDHVAEDKAFRDHRTPAIYGLQSYISMPIFLRDGSFFGTLCAIDPAPAKVSEPGIVQLFRTFADMIGGQLDAGFMLAQMRKDLSDARSINHWQDQFLATLGHDLRNPLAAVIGGARLLDRMKLGDRASFIADAIDKSANRMSSLIESILDLASGRLKSAAPMNRTTQGLEPALLHIVQELRLAYPGRAIETSIDLAGPVSADAAALSRILSNLLKNALTYGAEQEPIKVLVRSAPEFELRVTNKGPAIPEDLQKDLFQPFRRGLSGKNIEGLGLGLYIVAQIAEAHGGVMTVTSDENATSFAFRMPLPPEKRSNLVRRPGTTSDVIPG